MLRISCLRFTASTVWATVVDPTKTSLRDGIYPNFEFHIFTDYHPSPLSRGYQSLRAKEDYLFIIFRKPYTRASVNTLGRWIKQTLQAAGIDTNIYTAYSTRHASTSAAARRGTALDTIRQAAGWTSTSKIFSRFYQRPLVSSATISDPILQSTFS